jgi:hypothetical protein
LRVQATRRGGGSRGEDGRTAPVIREISSESVARGLAGAVAHGAIRPGIGWGASGEMAAPEQFFAARDGTQRMGVGFGDFGASPEGEQQEAIASVVSSPLQQRSGGGCSGVGSAQHPQQAPVWSHCWQPQRGSPSTSDRQPPARAGKGSPSAASRWPARIRPTSRPRFVPPSGRDGLRRGCMISMNTSARDIVETIRGRPGHVKQVHPTHAGKGRRHGSWW